MAVEFSKTPPGGVVWVCQCGHDHQLSPEFLGEELPDDLDLSCSFCGTAGPSLASVKRFAKKG